MRQAGPASVLFVAAEIYPMAKTGGLGDVAGALPPAMRQLGFDVHLMMPAYPSALRHVRDLSPAIEFDDLSGFGPTAILRAETIANAIPLWLVKHARLYERAGGPYADERGIEWPDNLERFALLCNAAAEFARVNSTWKPQLFHLNDWHTALVPLLSCERRGRRIPSLLTIHNAAYQGRASAEQLHSFGVQAEQLRGVTAATRSFLGFGVRRADSLNAVSPTYAKEIQTPKFGCGLEHVFSARSRSLTGILNGVDYSVWDPATDLRIAQTYDAQHVSGKVQCRRALLDEMKLRPASSAPVLGVVSRLTWQKGLDLLIGIADDLVEAGARLVVLGQGEPGLERGFAELRERHPKLVAANIRYDEDLAHRIMAGSDIFVMPSRFEPSGLNQMYSMRYGTVPVVSAVGGLADSVIDAGLGGIKSGRTTGFVMKRFGRAALAGVMTKAMKAHTDRPLWGTLVRNGMNQDFSWSRAAARYAKTYRNLIPN